MWATASDRIEATSLQRLAGSEVGLACTTKIGEAIAILTWAQPAASKSHPGGLLRKVVRQAFHRTSNLQDCEGQQHDASSPRAATSHCEVLAEEEEAHSEAEGLNEPHLTNLVVIFFPRKPRGTSVPVAATSSFSAKLANLP